jgi:hypothetical protein
VRRPSLKMAAFCGALGGCAVTLNAGYGASNPVLRFLCALALSAGTLYLIRFQPRVRVSRRGGCWFAHRSRFTLTGWRAWDVDGTSFWGIVKFFVVPGAYYRWRWRRKTPNPDLV